MPSRGIVPWSKKCAADKTVPSPPTATMRSMSAKCCLSNSTLLTHEKLTWCCRNIPSKSLTHCLCAWNLDSSRFHLNALGAWPRSFSCSGKKMHQGTGITCSMALVHGETLFIDHPLNCFLLTCEYSSYAVCLITTKRFRKRSDCPRLTWDMMDEMRLRRYHFPRGIIQCVNSQQLIRRRAPGARRQTSRRSTPRISYQTRSTYAYELFILQVDDTIRYGRQR